MEMLSDKPIREYIEEQAKVFNKAIDEHIDYEVQEELSETLKDNAYIFSGFKTYHCLSEVGLSLQDEEGNIKSWSQFRNDVKAIDKKYNERYLKAEYHQAIASAQMASKWAGFDDSKDFMLRYSTAGDKRVRADHEVLDGTTLPKADPFWSSYYPPNDWGCRCDTDEVLAKDYPKSDSQQAMADADLHIKNGNHKNIFKFNAGKERRLFPDKHPYFGKKGISHCNTLKLAYGSDDPCKVLSEVIKAKEKSATALEREKYLKEMKPLLKVKKTLEIENGKTIRVGFTAKGNKHLYSDTFGRSKYPKEELKDIANRLEQSKFMHSASLSKKRKDNISKFYYFKDEDLKCYYNVAEEIIKGRMDRFVYAVTDRLKKEKKS